MKSYSRKGIIILFALLFCSNLVWSQNTLLTIKGIVIDQDTQTPLIGASVLVEGTNYGTISDPFGNYELKAPSEESVALFSFVGYQTVQKTVAELLENGTVFLQVSVDLEPVTITDYIYAPTIWTGGNSTNISKIPLPIFSQDEEPSNLLSSLQGLPGIQAQQGALNTNRLIIRGLGTRTPFSTDQIKLYFDDIPLTNGVGESALEELEGDIMSGITIAKPIGTVSQGAELGGTITMSPNYHYDLADSSQVSLHGAISAGSFGRNKQSLGVHFLNKKRTFSNQVFVNRTHSDGYRANNNYERRSAYLLGRYRKPELYAASWSYLLHYRSLEAGIPSSLNINDFNEKPQAAAFNWASAAGNEDANTYLGGLSFRQYFKTSLISLTASVFAGGSDNFEIRPFNVLEEDSYFYGLCSSIDRYFESKQNASAHHITLGGEWRAEQYDQNLYETLDEGLVGEQFNDLTEERSEWFAYLAYKYISNNNRLTIKSGLTLRQRQFAWSGTQLDLSDKYTIPLSLLPTAQISYRLSDSPYTLISFSVGRGTSLSNGEESLTAATFGNILNPETGWNKELQFEFYDKKISGNISIFHLNVKDAVVNRQTIEGQNFLANGGSTLHQGIELYAKASLWQKGKNKLDSEITYTFGDYRFDDFEENGNDYSDNLLPGVPQHSFRFKGTLTLNKFSLQITEHISSKMPVNDGNTEFSDGYELLNVRAGYHIPLRKASAAQQRFMEVFAAVNNVFDKHYASLVQVNARGFGGNLPRFYYPGLPRYYYVGVALPL